MKRALQPFFCVQVHSSIKRLLLNKFYIEFFQASVQLSSSNCGLGLGRTSAHSPGPGNSSFSTEPFIMSCKHSRRGSKQVPQCVGYIVFAICINQYFQTSTLPSLPTGTLTKKQLRHILFEEAVDTIFTVDQAENEIASRSRALLQASSCFGNHQASLFLATIHLSGLRHDIDQEQVEPAAFQDVFSPL